MEGSEGMGVVESFGRDGRMLFGKTVGNFIWCGTSPDFSGLAVLYLEGVYCSMGDVGVEPPYAVES